MQDHEQHMIDDILISNLSIVCNIHRIPSNTTWHTQKINDLDHVVQLTRSIHEAQSGGDNHLATAMDPWSCDELLTHHLGGAHDDEDGLR